MNRNIIIILLIFLVPLVAYFGLSRDKLTTPPSFASSGPEVIKFASPMCYECQELEKVFEEVFPKYNKDITLKQINVTQKDNETKTLIKTYEVKLVPTTVFKDANGKTLRRIEGTMQPQVLENYLKELIDILGLERRVNHLPNELSGGQQQRVSIGRAMINNPAIMLADEPTGNLDSKASEEIISLLKLSNKKFNQTVVIITHDLEIAKEAERVITIEDGKIIKDERN